MGMRYKQPEYLPVLQAAGAVRKNEDGQTRIKGVD